MSSLPKTVTQQRRDCDLNPGPTAPESSALTTRVPRHPHPCVVFLSVLVTLPIYALCHSNFVSRKRHVTVLAVRRRVTLTAAGVTVLFCSFAVLDPWIRGLVTPMAVLSPFISVIQESPVQVFMLSIQAVRGLPRLRAPGIVPCIVSFSLFSHGVT